MDRSKTQKLHCDITCAALTSKQWDVVFGTMSDVEDPPQQFDTKEEDRGER